MERQGLIGGIGGIERKIREKYAENDKNIQEAFKDLNKLMGKAKEMAQMAQSIATNLRCKRNMDISDDETVLFKSQLLSLGLNEGLDDIVTRKKYANESQYYKELGKEISFIIKPFAEKMGGQIALTDVYCAVNRARGFDLISPDDVLNACHTLEKQKLGLKMVTYESGLIVIQCDNYNQMATDEETLNTVIKHCSESGPGVSAHFIALLYGISVSLARQRLLSCESAGLICRDESIQGLFFFPNYFLSKKAN